MLCRHCNRPCPDTRPRGLCWGCYFTPDIADRYPPMNARLRCMGRARENAPLVEAADANLELPAIPFNFPKPTAHPPGSVRKVAVMRYRARHRQPLFGPADASCIDANNRAADAAFAAIESLCCPTGFRELLAAARKQIRQQVKQSSERIRSIRYKNQLDEWDEDDSSASDWLKKELAAWRAKEAGRQLLQPKPKKQPRTERPGRVCREPFHRQLALVG